MDEAYVFTFGSGQTYPGCAVLIKGTYLEAREIMCERYGMDWSFQYSLAAWREMEKIPDRGYQLEKIIEVIE